MRTLSSYCVYTVSPWYTVHAVCCAHYSAMVPTPYYILESPVWHFSNSRIPGFSNSPILQFSISGIPGFRVGVISPTPSLGLGLCGVACSRSLCSLLHCTTQSPYTVLPAVLCCAVCCAVCTHRDVVLPPLVLVISHVVVSTRSRILRFCTFQYLDISDSGTLHFRYLHSGDLQLRCCDAVASYFILRAYSYILR